MNEQQWQECSLEEATHVKTNLAYHLPLNEQGDAFFGDSVVSKELFRYLGITPVRKAEVKPVEFTASFYRGVGGIWTHVTDPRTIPADADVLKFRCVEVQP